MDLVQVNGVGIHLDNVENVDVASLLDVDRYHNILKRNLINIFSMEDNRLKRVIFLFSTLWIRQEIEG